MAYINSSERSYFFSIDHPIEITEITCKQHKTKAGERKPEVFHHPRARGPLSRTPRVNCSSGSVPAQPVPEAWLYQPFRPGHCES
jgi:hypothetical protein